MILRPVRPASPIGPPVTNRPVGFTCMTGSMSRSSRGIDGRITDLDDVRAEPLRAGIGVVLGRDDDRPHAHRDAVLVLDGHLGLAVRPEVGQLARNLADLRQPAGHAMGERDRQRHELGRLAAREPEHHALVAGTQLEGRRRVVADLEGGVDALRDVRRLALDRDERAARLVVEAVVGTGVADVADRVSDDRLEVDVGMRRDLAQDQHQARRRRRLARHPGIRVVAHDRVEDRVRDLVAHLVGVTLGHRFRGEQVLRGVDDAHRAEG